MGPTQTPARTTRTPQPPPARALAAQRLDHLREQIEDSIIESSPGIDAELVTEVVAAAVSAFVDSGNDVRQAAASIAGLLEQVGEQHARRGLDVDDLAAIFRTSRSAAQKGLGLALGDLVTSDALVRLREDLLAYVVELHALAKASLTRAQKLQDMTPQQRRSRLTAMTFGLGGSDELEKLAAWEGIDPAKRVIAIVSISATIPQKLRQHPQAIAGTSAQEILVPEEWDAACPDMQLTGQAVACPAVALAQAADAVALARQAADLLRDGTITDSRMIVPGADLLGNLLVGSNRLLAELIINKHLSALEAMSVSRRVTLGELTLGSLESGQPIDQVAKQLGIPRQTAHSRMKAIRTILGEALHDPTQRLELIVALRAALPRWRHQLAGRSNR